MTHPGAPTPTATLATTLAAWERVTPLPTLALLPLMGIVPLTAPATLMVTRTATLTATRLATAQAWRLLLEGQQLRVRRRVRGWCRGVSLPPPWQQVLVEVMRRWRQQQRPLQR